MSAETLRKAAALMRKRAEAYDPAGRIEVTRRANVAHVCSWSPAVAFAVADLLDREADDYERSSRILSRTFDGGEMFPLDAGMLSIARAYLGSDA